MSKVDLDAQYVTPIYDHLKAGNTEEDLHIKTAPEGITGDSIKLHQTHDINFVAGATRAVTRLAKENFTANDGLESETQTLGMSGKNSVTVTAERTGVVNVTVVNRAADAGAGELRKATEAFAEAMKEAQEA